MSALKSLSIQKCMRVSHHVRMPIAASASTMIILKRISRLKEKEAP